MQWGELDICSWRVETARPDITGDALARLFALETAADSRLSPKWNTRLHNLFQSEGRLCDVVTDLRDPPPHMALAAHECMLSIHENIARTNGNLEIMHGVKELFEEVLKQTREGACWAFTRRIVVGRKPLA